MAGGVDDQAAVLDEYALGAAGGAGGEDGVGEGVGARERRRGGRSGGRRSVEFGDGHDRGRAVGRLAVGHQERGAGVGEQHALALLRLGGVEQDEGAAGPPDGQHHHHECGGARQPDADDHVIGHTTCRQRRSPPPGQRVGLLERQPFGVGPQRLPVGVGPRGRLEELPHGFRTARVGAPDGRSLAEPQDLLPLGRREQFEVADGRAGALAQVP